MSDDSQHSGIGEFQRASHLERLYRVAGGVKGQRSSLALDYRGVPLSRRKLLQC